MLGFIKENAKVKRTPPRSPRRSGVCRKLTFGASPLSRQETHGVYESEMESIHQTNRAKWNYDFLREVALGGRYQFKVCAETPIKNSPRKSPSKRSPGKVKKRSPKDVLKCACVSSNSTRSPVKRKLLMDFKNEGSGQRGVSPLAKTSKGMNWDSENVCPLQQQRVRASGVVRNLAALYWDDNNNNSPITNNNNTKTVCSPIRRSVSSGNLLPTTCKRNTPTTGKLIRKQSQITGEVMLNIFPSLQHP